MAFEEVQFSLACEAEYRELVATLENGREQVMNRRRVLHQLFGLGQADFDRDRGNDDVVRGSAEEIQENINAEISEVNGTAQSHDLELSSGTEKADNLPSSTIRARLGKRDRIPRPSRFCHICARTRFTSNHLVCSNISNGSCLKTVCERCFAKYNWGWVDAIKDVHWKCPHCRQQCPEFARCFVYNRTNGRRKKLKATCESGSSSSSLHLMSAPGNTGDDDSLSQLTLGPICKPLTPTSSPVTSSGIRTDASLLDFNLDETFLPEFAL
mmetsp:Transcript_15104/g.30688  ORF Transcript_15104/g.30688 Transcript_15104/m.30688 type:complete len:269 (-) Transcript_15104:1631-2437(-)